MEHSKGEMIFFLGQDARQREKIGRYLSESRHDFTCFNSETGLLDALDEHICNLLVVDMDSQERGLYPLERIKKTHPFLPILILSSNCKLSKVVNAVKAGATSYLRLPVRKDEFLSAVDSILDSSLVRRLGQLSKAENRVLSMVLAGKTNKEIACEICRSIRTIEEQRRSGMQKLGVHNVVDLVKIAMGANGDGIKQEEFVRE